MKTTIRKVFPSVPFAHRQPNHDGHCKLIHGHNWTIEVVLGAERMDENGFVLDFGKMQVLKDIIARFDHAMVLNIDDPAAAHYAHDMYVDLVTIEDCSCEGLARHFFSSFDHALDMATGGRVFVVSVVVHEDEKNSAMVGI